MNTASNPSPSLSLDDLYFMVAAIYEEQNALRPVSATFAHFVEVCGMLSIHARNKRKEEVGTEDALCKSLGWLFPLLAKLRVKSVEELVYRKFPYVCPYCRSCPHDDGKCKTVKGTSRTVDHNAVRIKQQENRDKRPKGLNEWQEMFGQIYPRTVNDPTSGRSVIGLLEELGELAEAVRVFDKHPKYFAGEVADVFSYIMGIATEFRITQEMNSKSFDFENAFLQRYPGLCLQCGYEVCICPSVPAATVGRLAKELDLANGDPLFGEDATRVFEQGKVVAHTVLQSRGGLAAVSQRFPFDRGETNRSIIVLCLHLADELQATNSGLAQKLRTTAQEIGANTRPAGSSSKPNSTKGVVEILKDVWPLLKLAAVPDDNKLSSVLGGILRAESVKIGVVTALPKEFAAMRAMFDEVREMPMAGDPNSYVIGSIPSTDGNGVHLVALTLLKQMGNNTAAAAATNLLRSFPSVEDVLMVGVAGGVPSESDASRHVRLGDVVVSSKEGVVQYDNLKVEVGQIKIRSSSSKPSARMLDRVNMLEADRIAGRYPWESYIERGDNLESGQRPGDEKDKLTVWKDGKSTEAAHPDDPLRRNGKPKIHYGRIGAANTLLKDPQLRDKLQRDTDVIAVEMEGSGIADGTWEAGQHYILIRGISDYCDPNKTKEWQGHAAVVAASYARALIASIPISASVHKT